MCIRDRLSCLLLCSLLCLYVLHVLERTVVETNTALTAYVQKRDVYKRQSTPTARAPARR